VPPFAVRFKPYDVGCRHLTIVLYRPSFNTRLTIVIGHDHLNTCQCPLGRLREKLSVKEIDATHGMHHVGKQTVIGA
jgi:hypothetical protein